MANKHEIQRDFYKKKNEWKHSLKITSNKKEILFDEEIYPEYKDSNKTRTYIKDDEER